MAKHAPKGAEDGDGNPARSLSEDMEEVPQEGGEAGAACVDMEADGAEQVAAEAAEVAEARGGGAAVQKVPDVMEDDEDFPNPDDFEEEIDAGV